MRDDSNLFEPLLDDGDDSKIIPVRRLSYREKLWGILPQSSAPSWLNIKNSVDCGVPRFSNKSTMTQTTRPLVKRKIWILILVLLALVTLLALAFIGALFCSPWKQQPSLEAGENTTAAKNLSLASLLDAKNQEPHWGAMHNCLAEAVQKFSEEPEMVRKNARMILQCNGTRQEFVSGKGEIRIEVVWINGMASYILDEATPEVHMARLGRHPLPLSLASISGVLQDLASNISKTQECLGELQSCLSKALQEFPLEPATLQDNAKLVVTCGGENLTFISGNGDSEINVYRERGEIQFQVKPTWQAWWARLFKGRLG
ncbi:uncharacterized protein LOC133380885 [Rhineura floridana]|uniref:uncharacterized protein LOC133380885 n=1 Tax=Rhineura floridana TaxID=261503 RepID=UPI002AC80DAF|nr:uncharacterized protein LOC133380885 [Rhineura floridana]XP_061475039.1 uncharacterized protein LOC133380885 [Rhineura floridana]